MSLEVDKAGNKTKGNPITMDAVMKILEPYKECLECLDMNVDQEQTVFNLVLAFASYAKSYDLYKELERYMNIGVNHGRDRESGKYLVIIQVYLV